MAAPTGIIITMVGKRIERCLLTILLAVACSSCADLFDVHPYAVDFDGETNVNLHQAELIERNCLDKDTLRVAVFSDTQGHYDELEDLVKDINNRGDIDFAVHGGDVSNYGATREFVQQHDILDRLDVPYVVVLGNHDCLGTGIETYHKMFGPSNFSFIAGRVKFVCLNTNALEYDFTDPIPDFDFLNTELQADASRYDRTVFCMHAPPLCEQFNNEVLQAFHHYLSLFPGVLFCTAGHLHKNDCFSPLDDGITYYVTDSANHRNYILFTITPNGYEAENIHY